MAVMVAAAAAAAATVATAASAAPAAPTHGSAVGSSHHPPRWVATWTAAPTAPANVGGSDTGFVDQTLREVVHVSVGGDHVRLHFSNRYGTSPLTIAAVTVAVQGTQSGAAPGTLRTLTFTGGSSSVVVPTGSDTISDAVALAVPDESNLLVSIYLPDAASPTTSHPVAEQTNYIAAGNHVADEPGTAFAAQSGPYVPYIGGTWYFLDAVDVTNCHCHGTVVTFGDSITDGFQSTIDGNTRWPDYLAARLQTLGDRWAVANEGISSNAVLTDGAGQAATTRFLTDAQQSGVRDVIFLEGINDIGNYSATAPQIIAGIKKIIRQAHSLGLHIYGGTLTPFQGAAYYTAAGENTRAAVNRFIRTGRAFDEVIDFAHTLHDPTDPLRLRPTYDSGDHLHPNAAGYRAMAFSIPLSLLR